MTHALGVFLQTTFILMTQRIDQRHTHTHTHRIYLLCVEIILGPSPPRVCDAFNGSSSILFPLDAKPTESQSLSNCSFFVTLFFAFFLFPQNRFSFRVGSKAALLKLVPHFHYTSAHYYLLLHCSHSELITKQGSFLLFLLCFFSRLFLKFLPDPFQTEKLSLAFLLYTVTFKQE